jgi:beta-lactamase class A
MRNENDQARILRKRNRILTVAFGASLLLCVGALAYAYFKTSDISGSFKNPYPLIDPARSIVAQEHFFSTVEPLRRELKNLTAKYEEEGSRIGIYFEYLNTGANVSINQDERFWPASLSKMPTAFAVMKKIEDGQWKLDNEMVLFHEDRDERFGDLYKQPAGTKFTIESLLKEILINSDNTAHRILVRNLSGPDYDAVIESLGMEELYDQEYNITPKEYSRVLRSLYNASYLNREHSQTLLNWLSETKFDDFLDAGIPPGVTFAHKIGEEFNKIVFLDSGIVYVPSRPFLITVMVDTSKSGGSDRAREMMKEIAAAAYEYVANN